MTYNEGILFKILVMNETVALHITYSRNESIYLLLYILLNINAKLTQKRIIAINTLLAK